MVIQIGKYNLFFSFRFRIEKRFIPNKGMPQLTLIDLAKRTNTYKELMKALNKENEFLKELPLKK